MHIYLWTNQFPYGYAPMQKSLCSRLYSEKETKIIWLSLLVTQTDYSAICRDIEQLIYRSALLSCLDFAHTHMHETFGHRNHFYYASKLISKSSFIFFYTISSGNLTYFVHISCTIFILSKYCYDLMPGADKKTVIFQFFIVFNIQSGGSSFISVCTLIVEKRLLFCVINKKISVPKMIIVLVDKKGRFRIPLIPLIRLSLLLLLFNLLLYRSFLTDSYIYFHQYIQGEPF